MSKGSSKNRSKELNRRKLGDLRGIGPAMLRDFEVLGVHSVEQLADRDGAELYERLNEIAGVRHDPCVLDTFHCAVAQARNPYLAEEQRNWWFWSRKRLALRHGARA